MDWNIINPDFRTISKNMFWAREEVIADGLRVKALVLTENRLF